MATTSIKNLLLSQQAMMKAALSVALDHPTTKGDHTEYAWIEFFKSFLPNKYAITKGFVFDSEGRKSKQIDIIIYDSVHSPLIYTTDAGDTYVTRESVYAVFECKQEITPHYLEYAAKRVRSVAELSPTSRMMYSCGVPFPAREAPSIIGGILATKGNPRIYESKIRELSTLDICVSLEGGTTTLIRDSTRRIERICHTEGDEAIPALYFSILDALHRLGTVPAIDVREYAKLCTSSLEFAEDPEIKPRR